QLREPRVVREQQQRDARPLDRLERKECAFEEAVRLRRSDTDLLEVEQLLERVRRAGEAGEVAAQQRMVRRDAAAREQAELAAAHERDRDLALHEQVERTLEAVLLAIGALREHDDAAERLGQQMDDLTG